MDRAFSTRIAGSEEMVSPDRPKEVCPRCPVCAAWLQPMRGMFRCGRCFFTLCMGCEAEMEVAPPTDD